MIRKKGKTIGKYTKVESSRTKGAYTIYGRGINKGVHIPPDDVLKKRYEERGGTSTINKQIQYRAVLDHGRPGLNLGKEALGIKIIKASKIPTKDVKNKFEEFWPKELVKQYLESDVDERPELGTLKGFAKKHKKLYYVINKNSRKEGNLRMKNLLEEVYPGLYDEIKIFTKYEEINRDQVRERLLNLHHKGIAINKTALEMHPSPSVRKLLHQVINLAQKERGNNGYSLYASKLTGIPEEDIKSSKTSMARNAAIAEKITKLLVVWAPTLNVDISNYFNIRQGELIELKEKRKFLYEKSNEDLLGISDLRIGNQAIEVKSGFGVIESQRLEDIIAKYSPNQKNPPEWLDGEPLEKSTLVLHKKSNGEEKNITKIENSGITVVNYEIFRPLLKECLDTMEKHFLPEIIEIYPRIHNLDNILKAYDLLVQEPQIFMRTGNRSTIEFFEKTIESLSYLGQEQTPF